MVYFPNLCAHTERRTPTTLPNNSDVSVILGAFSPLYTWPTMQAKRQSDSSITESLFSYKGHHLEKSALPANMTSPSWGQAPSTVRDLEN